MLGLAAASPKVALGATQDFHHGLLDYSVSEVWAETTSAPHLSDETGGPRLEAREDTGARCELLRSLARLVEPPGTDCRRLAEILELGAIPEPSTHTELFVHQLYPYASVYLDAEGQLGGEARDRIAGLWRVLGQPPPVEPDHLTVLLALQARLVELEADEPDAARRGGLRQARGALLWEHLLSWLPAYLHKLGQLAPPPYRRWSAVLSGALSEEARHLPPPTALPLHLREAPGPVDPREADLDRFLAFLLTPVRSGLILTRADLGRAARDLELGLRLGERRFILRALMTQDAAGTLAWVADEAAAWIAAHEGWWGGGETGRFWAGRAESTETLLRDLERDAASLSPSTGL